MARFRPSRSCSAWQVSSTRPLTALDSRRRLRSSRKNPATVLRLKKVTPNNHACTSHAAGSHGIAPARAAVGKACLISVEPFALATSLPVLVGQKAATRGEDFVPPGTLEYDGWE